MTNLLFAVRLQTLPSQLFQRYAISCLPFEFLLLEGLSALIEFPRLEFKSLKTDHMTLVFHIFYFHTPLTFFRSSWRRVISSSESFNFCFFSFTFISNTCSISASIFFIFESCSRFSSSIWAKGFLKGNKIID